MLLEEVKEVFFLPQEELDVCEQLDFFFSKSLEGFKSEYCCEKMKLHPKNHVY